MTGDVLAGAELPGDLLVDVDFLLLGESAGFLFTSGAIQVSELLGDGTATVGPHAMAICGTGWSAAGRTAWRIHF
ncbi:MAG: hypothetical protein V9F03_15605 [Microthrixaceae bacterium]